MTFKKNLSDHFKNFSASPFLFVGSGMSRRYLGAEDWEFLLRKFADLIDVSYTRINSQADGDLMKTASLLAETYAQKWWDSEIKGDKEQVYSDSLTKRDSPLKVEIADYLSSIHENILDEYREEVQLLASSKIDGVITTNWDHLLEETFRDFSVFIGQDGLFSSRNHGVAEIYKIHGCSQEPNSLVLTAEDYGKFRQKNPYLSSKLLTIFIEHPIIFLGYSLTDPHILEILEEIVKCFPADKMGTLRENIIFVEFSPGIEEPVITESIILKTLPVKLIRAECYKPIFEVLSEVKRRIPAHIFRRIKDELYDLVITNDPKGQLYVKEANDLDNNEGTPEFVVGYGAINQVKKSAEVAARGMIGLNREDIIRDIIFDNGDYDSNTILETVFPNLLKSSQINMPIFKYLNQSGRIGEDGTVNCEGLCVRLKTRVGYSIERYGSESERERSKKIDEVIEGISELYKSVDTNLFLRMAVFVPPEKMDLIEFQNILKVLVDSDLNSNNKSNFVKLVCVYDQLKYSKRYKF